jgi:hypothetical protein
MSLKLQSFSFRLIFRREGSAWDYHLAIIREVEETERAALKVTSHIDEDQCRLQSSIRGWIRTDAIGAHSNGQRNRGSYETVN